ncbi:uncharacterized protein EAF01_006318 [Botrytis porri]|uniref:uncharacterized protein n=1 Tax=Botrytis porri TaxID=87229 RepID=UPI0018FF6532|nr:uncharacterized protein EAF01_006318 [Botrytis porri]KAF7903269.1 hypothetical protein EAF01_006318 [Botrytis porri]
MVQYTSIGLRLSGLKLREDCHELSRSTRESSSDSTSNDSSGEKPLIKSAFSELSEELNKQSQQQIQQPLIPQIMGATTKGQPITDDQTMQDHQMRKMQMLANAKHSNYQIPTHMTTTMKDEPLETTNSSSDLDEGGAPIFIKPTPDCFEVVKEWLEQVETERQDTKKKLWSNYLQSDNSGTILEWPWVETELHGALQRLAVAESPTLVVKSRSDSEEVTSSISESISSKASPEQLASTGLGSVTSLETPCNAPSVADAKESTSSISECLSHLRGGDASNRNSFGQYFSRITGRVFHYNFQHHIDLGYGGSNFATESFPEYDPRVDLMYLNDFNGIYPTDIRRGIRSTDSHEILIVKLNPEFSTRVNRLESSSAESKSENHHDFMKNLDISTNSTHSYAGLEIEMKLRGGTSKTAESLSINRPSKSSQVSHKRDKLRAMVKIPLKSIKDMFCYKFKKQPLNKDAEDSDEYEGSEGISDKFKMPLETMEGKKGEERGESLAGKFEDKIQKKEKRLGVKTSYRLISHSILSAKLARKISQKRRNLARIAQRQLFRSSSPEPKPYGPTKIYLRNQTQLRGGIGNEREARFFKETRLRFARLIRHRSESEGAIAGPAPATTGNVMPGTEDGLQRHHRDDSGVSGVEDEQSGDKNKTVEDESPRQVVNLSEQGAETVETVREVDSDTSEERDNVVQVEHVEYVEDAESPKASEPEQTSRRRSEIQQEDNETEPDTQRRFRNELLDILWKFLALKEEIWFKRNAIIHGAPTSKHNFEAQLSANEVDDIRQYVQNSCEMVDVSNEPRDAVTFPNFVTRANNHLLRARRVREIFDNWYTREGQQQRQDGSSSNAREGSSETGKPSSVKAIGAGVLDSWPFAAAPSENFRRDRNTTSETDADIARTSSDTQLFRRRSSLILAPLPDLFPAPHPGQTFRGETRGESSRGRAGGKGGSSIAEKIDILRAKNNIPKTNISSKVSKIKPIVMTTNSNEASQGGMPNCHEQNEDHVYQEPIPEATMQRLRDLGASRVEAVNLLNATAGNADRAAEVLRAENPLAQEDMRNLLVDPQNDLQQVIMVTGVPPRRAFLALLVSESDVGGAIDLLMGEAMGATTNEEMPVDEGIGEEDSANGSSENEAKGGGEGKEGEESSSEGSDGEVAVTGGGFESLVGETGDNEGGDEVREVSSEGADVDADAVESDEECQPLVDKTGKTVEHDVHVEDDIANDAEDNEDNSAGQTPTIEVAMVFTSRKGKERAEGYDL